MHRLRRVASESPLDGGGTLTVLEFLSPLAEARAEEVAREWRDGTGDPALTAVRQAAATVDAEFRARTPWWDGIDLNAGNLRQALDRRVVAIDLFCMDGASMYAQVLQDADVIRAKLPGSRHILDIPYIARESTPTQIDALRTAWHRTAATPRAR